MALLLPALLGAPVVAQPNVSGADSLQADSGAWYRAALAVGAYAGAGMFVMENTWYRDREIVRFHFYDDSRAYLQVDKFGHAFGAYVQSYTGYHWLRRSGMTRMSAILYGASWGILLQTPIEIMDGIHEGWGFSWADMAANSLGSGLVIAQAALLDEQLIRFKFGYAPSRYADLANGYLGSSAPSRLLEDYNGHTYWLSIPLARLMPAQAPPIPPWLCLAVGYGANGMIGEIENLGSYGGATIPQVERYRQYYLSLDVDWSRVGVHSRVLRAVLSGINLVKVPLPALEVPSVGRVRLCWMCS